MTPATTPANLAPVFAIGFGTEHLLTNDFRLAYLQDADANPDGGFPTLTDGLPPASRATRCARRSRPMTSVHGRRRPRCCSARETPTQPFSI